MRRDVREQRRHPLAGSPTRFAATLIAALVGTSPAFSRALDGAMALPDALGRFLVAFAVFWFVGSALGIAFRRRDHDVLSTDMSEMVPGSAAADR